MLPRTNEYIVVFCNVNCSCIVYTDMWIVTLKCIANSNHVGSSGPSSVPMANEDISKSPSKPATLVCYICSREFGTQVLLHCILVVVAIVVLVVDVTAVVAIVIVYLTRGSSVPVGGVLVVVVVVVTVVIVVLVYCRISSNRKFSTQVWLRHLIHVVTLVTESLIVTN